MASIASATGWLRATCSKTKAFLRDRRGVAAVEFAFIAPVLLSLYFVTMEVAQAIESNKKVSRAASMVADLVTQQSKLPRADIEAILQIGNAIIYPYNRSNPSIEVTAIEVTNENTPKVLVRWSRKLSNNSFSAGLAKDTPVTIPDSLKIKGTFLVRVTAELDYRPVVTWAASEKASLGLAAAFDKIPMKETYYLRPRMGSKIECENC